MAKTTFNNWGTKSIELRFECDKCGKIVNSEEINVPSPNMGADKNADSRETEEGSAVCDCEKEFDIEVMVDFGGGYVFIYNLPDDWKISITEKPEDYDEDLYEAIINNTSFFETFDDELENLKQLNENEINISDGDTFRRLIFIGIIATLETYLSDAFINTINKSEQNQQKFVETYKDFKQEKFELAKIYSVYNAIDEKCKKALSEILYHNLSKVKGIYKDTLSIDFGDISKMRKYIAIRHNLVHRNGKTKDGNETNKQTMHW